MLPSKPATASLPQAERGGQRAGAHVSRAGIAALGVSGLWLALSALLLILFGTGEIGGALAFLLIVQAVLLPIGVLWLAVMMTQTAQAIREEAADIQAAISAIRPPSQAQTRSVAVPTGDKNSIARKLDEIAASQRKTETALAVFSSSRPQPAEAAPPAAAAAAAPAPVQTAPRKDDAQRALPLDVPTIDTQPLLERSDFIRALNFPVTAEDKAGFNALRRAMKDRPTAQLIQASQDVLTLLSENGIYMEDLQPDMARPEIWRSFAGGARGRAIAALGGIRDRSSLALVAARMKSDPIFRDAAHHFLRRFDQMFSSFADMASDSDISDLSDTRTARAFMLLGRVAGTFD